MDIRQVGEFRTKWGESVVWDDTRQRLYFVDCATHELLWLEGTTEIPETFRLPSMPTGVVPTHDGHLVVVLDDGLYRCDVDRRSVELISPFPESIGGRCNDACADLDGNIITGKLNFGPADGAAWQYSFERGWTMLDPAISNTNGPAVLDQNGTSVLIIGDTSADYFGYEYDSASAMVSERWVFGATDTIEGGPDGTTVDIDNGLWGAIVGGGELRRFTSHGLDQVLSLPVPNPTDVAFGGPDLDRLYVTTIGGDAELAGALLVIEGLDWRGRPEPRV